MSTPFLILAAPRSRTSWISKFLSYQDWHCGHEQLLFARSIDDIRAWFSMDHVGTVETGAMGHWRLAKHLKPDLRLITIRRKSEDIFSSLTRVGLPVPLWLIESWQRKLDQVEKRNKVVRVEVEELKSEGGLRKLWSAALDIPFDLEWAERMQGQNIQVSVSFLTKYFISNEKGIKKLLIQAKAEELGLLRPRRNLDSISIQEESFDSFLLSSRPAVVRHLGLQGEKPEGFETKNLALYQTLETQGNLIVSVARSNGRTFGYLFTILSPSLDSTRQFRAVFGPFFADKSFPGLGLRLQRHALDLLGPKGISEVWWQENEEPSVGALARRLGALPHGKLFRKELSPCLR